MKILQLCKKFPYPAKDGETIAVSSLSRALNFLGCEITLACINSSKHHVDVKSIPQEINPYKAIYCVDVDNAVTVTGAFANLFSKESYHVSRFVSEEFKALLIKILKQEAYDIIQLETLYLAPYIETIRTHSKAIISMRAHNVEHEIWERVAGNTSFFPQKWYLNYLTKKLKSYEIKMLSAYDYLVTVSKKDLDALKTFGYNNHSIVSPIGIDIKSYKLKEFKGTRKALSLCFIGSLDWMPNLEGVDWFLKEVWPSLNAKYSNLEFHIAGRNTPQRILNMKMQNVYIHGEVESALEFMNGHGISIVPLFSGSGMRVKILEGMALGNLIITTSLGLEGISAKHGKHLFIADTAEAFLDILDQCHEDPMLIEDLGSNAQAFVSKHYDNVGNAKELLKSYNHLLVSAE